ncbi:MAG: hypothetical protein ACNA8S_15450 [Deferrisomatales bacterium]
MVGAELPFTERTARYFMTVAEAEHLSNRNHGSDLPASWRTLAVLARLAPEHFEEAVADHRIGAEMTRREAEDLVRYYQPPPGRRSRTRDETHRDRRTLAVSGSASRCSTS